MEPAVSLGLVSSSSIFMNPAPAKEKQFIKAEK